MSAANNKHRPVFSSTEVTVLAHILKTAYIHDLSKVPYHPDYPNDHNRAYDKVTQDYLIQLIAKVSTLESKIANNAIKPAYTTKPSKAVSLLEDLGASADTIANVRKEQTKEEYWEQCYNKWSINPTSCTVPELDAVLEHKYLNDLMGAEELACFEAAMLADPAGGTS